MKLILKCYILCKDYQKKSLPLLNLFERIWFPLKEITKICSLGESVWNLRLKFITIKFPGVIETDTEGVKLVT